LGLLKNTASEWVQDKCPQLGAALACYTVFSLAPLVLVLLAVFGLIFGERARPGKDYRAIALFSRSLSFAMVGGVCFLLLVSLTVESLPKGFNGYLKSVLPGGDVVALVVFFAFDLAVVVLLFAMMFRYLPDAKIAWRDVWIGAALTAVLFGIGKFVLGLYLGSGAASSLITLLLWVFYAAQIMLFGAEFTPVYANAYGSQVEPEEHAVKVEPEEIEAPTHAP
jgi:membrane protein